MIVFSKLKWSNCFSYGKDNKIDFSKDQIVQLVGKNGHGKSSIPLILEECLFSKNSKGIKKADILNRYIDDKSYSIDLEFEKDGDIYQIKTSRGSTQTVILTKNGTNISAHTATNTFKMIEEILGFDHKTFTQLVYQSSSTSLSFLTSTDTTRKKFLIDLLNLSAYTAAFEHFKQLAKDLSENVTKLETKISTTQAWLDKHSREDLTKAILKEVPTSDEKLEEMYYALTAELSTIDATNKKITTNNTYRKMLSSIPIEVISKPVQVVESDKQYVSLAGEHRKTIKDANAFISKINKLEGTCPTCLQKVDESLLSTLISEQEILVKDATNALKFLDKKIDELALLSKETAKVAKLKADWENYHSLIDNTLPEQVLDADDISSKITAMEVAIKNITDTITEVTKFNLAASARNSKVDVILSQMDSMSKELIEYNSDLASLSKELSTMQILQKTFSTNGLIAYKIECLVKDLEILANEYLAELSYGRFQLTFKVSGGDKLNVIITDNGKDIDILALSGGERARVNTATLLAIRKLMQSLSNARINLLILDETIDSLDTEGKERLVELLVKEEHLNTFLISHGFSHPLLEKITVIKENNLSRLE